MSDKPKRAWFRFHLLTAVLTMLVVSAFLGAYLLVRDSVFDRSSAFEEKYCLEFERRFSMRLYQARKFAVYRPEAPSESIITDRSFGWPFVAGGIIESRSQPPVVEYCMPGLLVDVAVAVCALLATIFASEFLIRRREGRRQ